MDEVDFAGVMRVGIFFARLTVSRPASMTDTDFVVAFMTCDFFFETGDFSFRF